VDSVAQIWLDGQQNRDWHSLLSLHAAPMFRRHSRVVGSQDSFGAHWLAQRLHSPCGQGDGMLGGHTQNSASPPDCSHCEPF
jgi:hypothetical protein